MPETTTNLAEEVITTDSAIERADADRFLLNNLAGQLSAVPNTGIDLQLDEAVSVTLRRLQGERYRSAAADPFNYLCGGDSSKSRLREIAGAAGIDFVLNRVNDGSRVDVAVSAFHLEDYAKQLAHSRICRTKARGLGLLIDYLQIA